MSSVIVLLLSQFELLLFLFLLWLPWLRLPSLSWIRVARMNIFVLFLILEEKISAFHHWEWCLLWVLYMAFYVEIGSLYVHFLEHFHHKWVLNFVKAFSASIEMIIWFLFFNLLMIEIKEGLTKWKDIPYSWTKRSNLVNISSTSPTYL